MTSPLEKTASFTSVVDIARVIWAGRNLIFVVATLFTLAGGAYAFLATSIYKAEVVVAPAERNRMSDALGQFGGLASLAGVNIRGGADGTPIAVLRSREFAADFVSNPKTLAALGDRMGDDQVVDPRDVADYFDRKVRAVEEDKRLGLVTVSIKWTDPDTAANWANTLIVQLNNKLRDRALAESQKNVDYLQREIAAAKVPSLQQSLGRVLEYEMQKLLLARGNEEFAFKVVDRAIPPLDRYSPQRTLVVLLSLMIGLSIGCILALSIPRYRQILDQ
jgi:uncharacterized protein involved in exopolysaccharide biosynthesis